MNVFRCCERLGKSKTGVNERYKSAIVYMPASPLGSRFKYRRLSTIMKWNSTVDINDVDPYKQFQHESDPKPSTAFMIFARCSKYFLHGIINVF